MSDGKIMSSSDTITVSQTGGVVTIHLNRPHASNAINWDMETAINQVMTACEQDDAVKCILLAANGANFSAGHDIAQVARERVTGEPPATFDGKYWARTGEMLPSWNFSKAFVVAVKGYVGPHALAFLLTADAVIAADNSVFSLEECRIGIGAPYGPYALMPFHFPIRALKQLWLSGGWMDAETALRLFFVNRVVPLGREEEEAARFAQIYDSMELDNLVANKRGVHQLYEAAGLPSMIDVGREPYMPQGDAARAQDEHFHIIHTGGVAAAVRSRGDGVDRAVSKL